MTEYTTRGLIERMTALGAQLMPLKRGIKKPSGTGWTVAAALTVDQAVQHVADGGNLGVNLGNSKMIAFDCEDQLATDAVVAAGFQLTVIPAKAQYEGILKPGLEDPDSGQPNRKRGGSHVWLWVPDGIDPAALSSEQSMQLKLPNGGTVDVLAGPRYVVAPPSALDLAYDRQYLPSAAGPLDLSTGQEPPNIGVAPMWLFDLTVPCPPELASLHGCLIPLVRQRVEQNARSIELSNQIDEVPWGEWLAGDPRLTLTGEIDGCGCEIAHYQGASHGKSVTLHDGCEVGNGCHVWSGTMLAELGLPGDHLSRLDLAVALQGESRRVVAAGHGIQLGEERQELGSVRPSNYDRLADHFASSDPERSAMYREAAEVMRRSAPTPEQRGETFTSGQVLGAVRGVPASMLPASAQVDAAAQAVRVAQASAPAPTIGTLTPTEGANALAPETATPPQTGAKVYPFPVAPPNFGSCTSSTAEDPDAPLVLPIPAWAEPDDDPEPDEVEVEPDMVVRDFTGTPPAEGQIMQYPMPEIPSHVKPVQGGTTAMREVLPPLATQWTHAYVRYEWIWSATPGLSQVAAAADARGVIRWGMLGALLPRVAAKIPATVRLVPDTGTVPTSAGPTPAGASINLYSVLVGQSGSGKTVTMNAAATLIPGVRTVPPGTGEGILKEFPRPFADEDGGSSAGSAVGDAAPPISNVAPSGNPESLMLESDEIDIFVGEMMRQGSKTTGWYRSMWMGGEIGNTASEKERRSFVAAHSYRFGILLGAQPDAVAPLFGETGKGTPQRFMWMPAQLSIPRGEYLELLQVSDVPWFGSPTMIPQRVLTSPVWVYPPRAATKEKEKDRWRAALSNPTASPRVADRAAAIANRHAVLQKLKLSVLLAALDGLVQPQSVHWFCAGAIMEVRREMIRLLVAEGDLVKAEGARDSGAYAGVARAAADAARETERERNVARCARCMADKLIEEAMAGKGPRSHSDVKKILSGKKHVGGYSDRQMYGPAALNKLLADTARFANTGTHVRYIGGRPAV